MDELIFTLGLIFQLSGPPLPIQCRFLAITVTEAGPRIGLFCEAMIPRKGKAPNEKDDDVRDDLRAKFILRLDD
jgi:hypothetical protein